MKNVTKQFALAALAALVACASGASMAAWGQVDCIPRCETMVTNWCMLVGNDYLDTNWCGTVGDDYRPGSDRGADIQTDEIQTIPRTQRPLQEDPPEFYTDVIQTSWRAPVEIVIPCGQPSDDGAPTVDKPGCTVGQGSDGTISFIV